MGVLCAISVDAQISAHRLPYLCAMLCGCRYAEHGDGWRVAFAGLNYALLIRSTGLMVSPRLASAMAWLISRKS